MAKFQDLAALAKKIEGAESRKADIPHKQPMHSYVKLFLKKLEECASLDGRRRWQIFDEWAELLSLELAQQPYNLGFLPLDELYEKQENNFLRIMKSYRKQEARLLLAEMSLIARYAIHYNPYTDFLGAVFEQGEFQDKHKGQFFTPPLVAKMMARMYFSPSELRSGPDKIIKVNDPACGASVMLIEFADMYYEHGFDPRERLQFWADDVSRICFNMSFIQLSLMNLMAVVRHMNSLSMQIYEVRPTLTMMAYLAAEEQERQRQETEDRMRKMWRAFDDLLREGEPRSTSDQLEEIAQISTQMVLPDDVVSIQPDTDLIRHQSDVRKRLSRSKKKKAG